MIAIDPPVRILIFLLHPRGRPHMHQGVSAWSRRLRSGSSGTQSLNRGVGHRVKQFLAAHNLEKVPRQTRIKPGMSSYDCAANVLPAVRRIQAASATTSRAI